CECGALVGEAAVDTMCTKCKVFVSADATATRRQRLAKFQVASMCRHPLDRDKIILDEFPIAPIGFRTDADGSPNALGRKFEALIEVNAALRERLPKKGSTEFFATMREHDTADLQAALDDIVGTRDPREDNDEDYGDTFVQPRHTLLGLMFSEIA